MSKIKSIRRNNDFTYQDGISLRDYFDTKIESIKTATDLAREGMEKRLEGMNEFRNSLKDQSNSFIPRSEINIIINKINDDIRGLREFRSALEGKASSTSVYISYIIAILGIIIGIIGILMH